MAYVPADAQNEFFELLWKKVEASPSSRIVILNLSFSARTKMSEPASTPIGGSICPTTMK